MHKPRHEAIRRRLRYRGRDTLDITTWKEVDLTRTEVLVRFDGKISFPLLNDVQAAGVTTGALKKTIEDGLKSYVAHPVVTVAVAGSE